MKKKLLLLTIIFSLISITSFYFINKDKIKIDLSDYAYDYLPESAKNFVVEEAKRGNKVLTERNKEIGKVYLNPLYVNYLNLSEEDKSKTEVIPQMYIYDYIPNKALSGTYEEKYNLKDEGYLSKIKDQGTLGICWSYATIASLESNILKSGLSSNEINFAERQIDYAMSNDLIEIDNPYSIENYAKNLSSYVTLTKHELGKGSNFVEASKYLNLGISPIEESFWNEYNNLYQERSLYEVINTNNVNYQVTSYNIYGSLYSMDPTINHSYQNEIKNHIKTYGALYVSTLPPSSDADYCYDASKNLITDDGSEECRANGYHAMNIIGWDDTYDGVGAWILKNSWGDRTPYTYLSYASYISDVSGITGVKEKNWDNVYDYTKENNKRYSSKSLEITYKKPNLVENLERISFSGWGINASYNIYVKNKNASYKLIETVNMSNPGMVTIDVNDFSLTGDEFSIKITTTNGIIEDGVSAFTSNLNSNIYLEEYSFNETITKLNKKLFVRNVESGSNLTYYIFDDYGRAVSIDSSYVINGTVDINENLNLERGNYILTFNPDYYFVSLDEEYVELDINTLKTYQLNYEISSNLNIKNITFSSSDSQIITVSETGLITAINPGTATITLNVNDEFILTCSVIVGPIERILGVEILEANETIYRNIKSELDLHVNVYPHDANYSEVIWTSNNENVATVDNGRVSFKNNGNVSITVTIGDLSDTVNFVVKEKSRRIVLNQEQLTLNKDETYQLALTNGSLRNNHNFIKYASSNENVATISNSGLVVAKGSGTTWITVTLGQEKTACFVTVIDNSIDYILEIDDGTNINYQQGKTTETFQVNNLDNKEITISFETGKETELEDQKLIHIFNGWNFNGGGEFKNNIYTFGYNDGYLKAKWQTSKILLPDISNYDENSNFEGWYKDSEFNEFLGKNIEYNFYDNITLYAKWTIKPPYKIADVNNDSEIDITDLVILGRYLVGLENIDEKYLQAADVNKDGEIDITDLVILGRYLVGLEDIN